MRGDRSINDDGTNRRKVKSPGEWQGRKHMEVQTSVLWRNGNYVGYYQPIVLGRHLSQGVTLFNNKVMVFSCQRIGSTVIFIHNTRGVQ